MDNKEKLIESILKECAKDGEPITREEAEVMADMEIKAKGVKNYVQSDEPKKERKPKERKVDEDKKVILDILVECLSEYEDIAITGIKNEVSLDFDYYGYNYTLKLTRHRQPK